MVFFRKKKYRRAKRSFRRKRKFVARRKLSRHVHAGNITNTKLKLVNTSVVTSDIAGVMNAAILTRDPSGAQDFSNFAGLYDVYKVNAVAVKYIPNYPNNTTATTAYQPLYIVYDIDHGTNPLTSINVAIQYESLKVRNMNRPWSVFYRNPVVTQSTTATSIYGRGWVDINTPCANGVIGVYGTGFSNSSVYGTLVITYYVSFRDRR